MIVKSEKYWADLLEQYKLGSISKSDRFELEKRALDDPFLFDALEGYSTVSQEAAPQKKEKTKLLTLPRMAAAASLVFLVAMIFLLKNDNTQEITSDQSIAMVLDKNTNEADISKEEKINPSAKTVTTTKEEVPETSPNSQYLGESKTTPTQGATDQKTSRNKEKKEKEQDVILEKSNIESDKPVSVSSDNPVSTHVSSEDEEEIEFDDIITETTQEEVRIPSAKKLEANTKESQRDLDNSGSQATADNNSSLPTTKAKKAIKEEAPSTFYIVEPAIGKKDFDEYVKENIDNRGLRQPTPHDVTIEFSIDKNGTISNFLHIYNGCAECGGYAIYLLSSSGVWKTSPEGQEGRARYILKF